MHGLRARKDDRVHGAQELTFLPLISFSLFILGSILGSAETQRGAGQAGGRVQTENSGAAGGFELQ